MNKATYYITGMTCGSCAMHIEKEMGELPEVENAYVDFGNKTLSLTFNGEPLSLEALQQHMATIGKYSLSETPHKPKSVPSRSRTLLWVALGILGVAIAYYIFY